MVFLGTLLKTSESMVLEHLVIVSDVMKNGTLDILQILALSSLYNLNI